MQAMIYAACIAGGVIIGAAVMIVLFAIAMKGAFSNI